MGRGRWGTGGRRAASTAARPKPPHLPTAPPPPANRQPQDIPDVKGDDRAGVRTLSVRIGVDRVFWACVWLLTAAFGGASAYCLWRASSAGWAAAALVRCAAGVGGSAGLVGLLWSRARALNTKKRGELADYYMLVWKCFYLSYLMVPFFG